MNRCLLSFGILILSSPLFSDPRPASVFGRFVGVLRHEKIKMDQLAKLDFIPSQETSGNVHLMAVLTLYFGDFSSKEYVSYHFDDVSYNFLTNMLVFDQPDQPITLITEKFTPNGFVGRFRYTFAGAEGKLILKKGKKAEPENPLIEPVWGEYRGKCERGETTLQLYTFRSTEETIRAGNPFMAYEVRGLLGLREIELCRHDPHGRPCMVGYFDSSSYNFYTKRLTLFGSPKNLVCEVNGDSLTCDGCTLNRISKETQFPRNFTLNTAEPAFATEEKPESALKGDGTSTPGPYTGYLHHESLDIYQSGGLHVLSFQKGTDIKMSAVAFLFFGGLDSAESISYRFEERSYPILIPQFVLRRPTADVDAVVRVTSLGDGVVKGEWFSLLFGRVGTFEFRKSGPTPIPSGAKIMDVVGGSYKVKNIKTVEWQQDVRVGLAKTPVITENPFYPLSFGGLLGDGAQFVYPNRAIKGGSYDFYTGRIAFLTEDPTVLAVGERVSGNELRLKTVFAKSVGIPLQDHLPEVVLLRSE